MSKVRFAFRLLLCVLVLPAVLQAQNQEVLTRQTDESARTRDEREQARDILLREAEQLKDSEPEKAAGFFNRAGRLQLRLNSSREAIASYQTALKLLKPFPKSPIRIDSLNGLASVSVQLGQCRQAQKQINQALLLSEQINSVAGRAEALLTLSDCQSQVDQNLARATFEESLQLFTSIGDKRGMARAYMLLGDSQLVQSDLVGATRSNEAALSIWRELGVPDEQASALINLGFVQYRRGAWQECMNFLTEAQSLLDEKSEPGRLGQIYSGIAEAFMESGVPDAGLKNARLALSAYQQAEDAQGVAAAIWDIGKAHYLLGEYGEAIKWLESARKESEAIGNGRIVAFCDDFLGRTHLANGDQTRALEYLKAALQSYKQLNNPRELARTEVLIGRIYEAQGRADEARRLLLKASVSLNKLTDRVNEAVALLALGKLELRANNLDRAEQYLQRSIEVTEQIRGATTSGDLTTSISATVSDRYEAYIDCLMLKHLRQPEKGLAARAFETSELARARTLAGFLRSRQTGLASLDPQLAAEEKSILLWRRSKENARISLLQKPDNKEALSALEAELNQIEAQYQQLQNVIRARYPAYQQLMHPDALTLREIQMKVLGDDQTLLLEYALGEERSYLWVVSRSEFSSYQLPGKDEIEDVARTLYGLLTAHQPRTGESFHERQERTRSADALLPTEINRLSQLLLAPIADKLLKKRLIIVADGALQYIPFQVLNTPSSGSIPLILDHEIVNQPSASTLALLLNDSIERTPSAGSVAIFADPVFETNDARLGGGNVAAQAKSSNDSEEVARVLRDVGQPTDNGSIPRLLASREEAEAIMAVVPWRTAFKALDFHASRATLATLGVGQYRIMHFATHTMINNENPQLSGIVLSLVDSGGRPVNGFLRMSDIYDLRLSSNLVVLSACSTALGKEVRGEGLIGLTRGFFYAGASGVTASLWKVDDEATAELMRRFYEAIFQRGLTPAAALREAQLAMLNEKRWRAPYYWAAFVIQGNYNQTESSPARWTLLSAEKITIGVIMGLLLLTALTIGFLRKKRMS